MLAHFNSQENTAAIKKQHFEIRALDPLVGHGAIPRWPGSRALALLARDSALC